eukprot:gb/GECG01007858.1/.p1 GENE.gb/GECG01007858.1/~~gb/GECG01007858.1/.p1  ORF type:complete len:434 (+),score=63.13 gb/GECG01007858.1/:1-1302(+)
MSSEEKPRVEVAGSMEEEVEQRLDRDSTDDDAKKRLEAYKRLVDKQQQLSPMAQRLYMLSALSKQGEIIPQCAAKRLKSALLKDDDARVKEALNTAQHDYSHLRERIMETFRTCVVLLRYEPNAIDLLWLADAKAEAEFHELFKEHDTDLGKHVSRDERRRMGILDKDTNLVYGEVEFNAFADILSQLTVPPNSKFIDLGSGSGKAVYAAAMLQDFAHVAGIECLESLHNIAVQLLPRFTKLQEDNGLVLEEDTPEIVFHHGSFLDDRFDWSDYNVVFANSTCYDDKLMNSIAEKCSTLSDGAYIITFTRNLDAPYIKILSRQSYYQSWGAATCYIHQKVNSSAAALHNSFSSAEGDRSETHHDMMSSPQSTALLKAKQARSRGMREHHVAQRLQHDDHDDGSASPQGDALLARKISQFQKNREGTRLQQKFY